ncbi:hypothetical protein STEG23_002252 [Scotinomys teguina]
MRTGSTPKKKPVTLADCDRTVRKDIAGGGLISDEKGSKTSSLAKGTSHTVAETEVNSWPMELQNRGMYQTYDQEQGKKRKYEIKVPLHEQATAMTSWKVMVTEKEADASYSLGIRQEYPVQLQLSAESAGEVYIKGTETGQYLAMDTDGLLYGSQTPNEECLFLERLEENHYNTYTSKKHAEKSWFVGLKKNGSCKRGPRTHYGQKAILFLPLPVSSD